MGRPKDSKNGVRCTIEKICETCAKTYLVEPYRSNSRFCSKPCQAVGHSKELFRQTERRCLHCGKSFLARPASERLYCSTYCASLEHGAKVSGDRTERTTSTCPVCGRIFSARATLHQVHCSRSCANRSYERRITLACKICKKQYIVRQKFSDQKYCSRACRTIGIGKTESYLEKLMAKELLKYAIPAFPQYPLGPYTVDFALPTERIVIECDGDYWHSLPQCAARDKRKDKFFKGRGWRVLRFREKRLRRDLSGCIADIRSALLETVEP